MLNRSDVCVLAVILVSYLQLGNDDDFCVARMLSEVGKFVVLLLPS